MGIEKEIECPRCHRKQPKSLGACDFCEEMRQDAQEHLNHEMYGEEFEEPEEY